MKPGDKVVCINSSMQAHTVAELLHDIPNWIKKDQIYTVREIVDLDFIVGIRLEEVHNPPIYFKLLGRYAEPTFRIDRFRLLQPSQTEEEQEQMIQNLINENSVTELI